jgi:hypothetical protein
VAVELDAVVVVAAAVESAPAVVAAGAAVELGPAVAVSGAVVAVAMDVAAAVDATVVAWAEPVAVTAAELVATLVLDVDVRAGADETDVVVAAAWFAGGLAQAVVSIITRQTMNIGCLHPCLGRTCSIMFVVFIILKVGVNLPYVLDPQPIRAG